MSLTKCNDLFGNRVVILMELFISQLFREIPFALYPPNFSSVFKILACEIVNLHAASTSATEAGVKGVTHFRFEAILRKFPAHTDFAEKYCGVLLSRCLISTNHELLNALRETISNGTSV